MSVPNGTQLGASLSVQRKGELDALLKHPKELQHLLREKQRRQATQLYREETGADAREGRIAVHMLANKILADCHATQLAQHDKTAPLISVKDVSITFYKSVMIRYAYNVGRKTTRVSTISVNISQKRGLW